MAAFALKKKSVQMKRILFISLMLLSSSVFSVEWGSWAEVAYVYVKTDTGKPYVQLASGSMPNCYQDSGGYLHGNDIEKAYSTILSALMAKRKVRVLYELTGSTEGWGMCNIKSLYIR